MEKMRQEKTANIDVVQTLPMDVQEVEATFPKLYVVA